MQPTEELTPRLQKQLRTASEYEGARLKKNLSTHDERIEAIVNSGYNFKEAAHAVKITTNSSGYESTQRAAVYLRENSRTPLDSITTALGSVQERVSKLTKSAEKELDTFGPELSDLIDSLPQVSKQAVFIKRLHDMQVLKHLSSCAKSADALRLQIFQHPEYKNCEYLGKICLAVCKDCEKCTSNREKAQKKEWEAQQALAKVNGKLNPLPPRGYALSDSIVDLSITPSWCRICQLGERFDIEDGTNLLHCDACNRGTHDACEVLAEYLDADSSSFFLCTVCQRYPQKGLRPVDPRKPRAAPTRQRRAVQISPAKEFLRRPTR